MKENFKQRLRSLQYDKTMIWYATFENKIISPRGNGNFMFKTIGSLIGSLAVSLRYCEPISIEEAKDKIWEYVNNGEIEIKSL